MLLLHCCCGPCALYPLEALRAQGKEVIGYFYNPNIHPFKEFEQRLDSFREMADRSGLECIIEAEYGLVEYLRHVVMYEDHRCNICYGMRLRQTARKAAELGAGAFSSTLLYSRYQNNRLIHQRGAQLGERYKVPFYYEDFRVGWQKGIDASKEMGLYRQPYCGCIYSEQERYDKSLRRNKFNKAEEPAGSTP